METPDRRTVFKGGLVGLGIGVALVALSLFFLGNRDAPQETLGIFLPLAAGLVSLAMAVLALVPLRYGDTLERSPGIIAWWFRAVALLGLVITVLGVVVSELPWTAFALAPLAAIVALTRDSIRRPAHAAGPA